jgi:hypothetical protein
MNLRNTLMSEFKDELAADVIDENGLTNKENKFLEVLFGEAKGNIQSAMKLSGLTGNPNTLMKRLSKHIKTLSEEYMAAHTGRAVISLVSIFDDPNAPGNKNLLTAAKEVLDRGGVVKEEKQTITEQNFMFILPAKEKDDEE